MASGRILIVDDDVFVRKSLKRALGTYEVVLAQDGEQALEILATAEPFDVILCDLMMPGVSGMDLYDHVRQRSPGKEEKMVFLTGGAVTDEAETFVKQASNPVIEKPFDFQRLRSVIEAMVGEAPGS